VGLAAATAFLPALEGEFLEWDDRTNLVDNTGYRGLGWRELRWMWTSTLMGQWIPVTWATLALDYLVWGLNPAGFHLTNLLLHAVNAVLVWLLARQVLALALLGLAGQRPALEAGATLAALLFALHPLRVESVAWITERRDVLSGLFYLAAVLLYVARVAPRPGPAWRRPAWWGLVGLGALAMGAKAMAVTLPPVLLLLDVYPLGRLPASPRRWLQPAPRSALLDKAPLLLLALGTGLAAIWAQAGSGYLTGLHRLGPVERLAVSAYAAVFYLVKTVAPVGLSPLYELPEAIRPASLPFVGSALAVLGVTALALGLRRRFPGLLAGWLAYLVMALPVIGILHNGHQIAADRYTYLPCLPWALLAGGLVGTALTGPGSAPRLWRAGLLVAAAGATLGLAALTWHQARVWRDSETLWSHAVRVTPSAIVRANLGVILTLKGRVPAAVAHLQEAVSQAPRSPEAHNNLGLALATQGRRVEAIEHYRRALALRPRYPEAHNNLGLALAREGDTDGALVHFREALAVRPAYAEAHSNLGAELAQRGDAAGALHHLVEALRLQPDLPRAHNNLGVFLARRGEVDRALAHFRAALAVWPGFPEAHNNLGVALAGQGRLAAAAEHFRAALRIRPDWTEARANLDRALRELREAPGATAAGPS
jgi:tetratricopeptide (TPR) repeat protein